MIALDKQLRFAENVDIHPGSPSPHRVGPVNLVPRDDIAYAAALLIIKPPFGSREVGCGARSLVMAAEHERIQLEEELQIAHREQINALGQRVIHEAIAGHHIGNDAGIEAVTSRLERLVYFRKWACRFRREASKALRSRDLPRRRVAASYWPTLPKACSPDA